MRCRPLSVQPWTLPIQQDLEDEETPVIKQIYVKEWNTINNKIERCVYMDEGRDIKIQEDKISTDKKIRQMNTKN